MHFSLENFFLSFIPLFVAIDVLAVVPVFLSFTEGMSKAEKKKLVTASSITALGISVLFLSVGKMLFSFLGISENDFRIGGGILLLVISVNDLLLARSAEKRKPDVNMGVVPLGIPLTIGPAALTTILILVDAYGYVTTLASLMVNLLIVWIVFRHADQIIRFMGRAGANAFARVMAIFMAAIGVMMIRVGLEKILQNY